MHTFPFYNLQIIGLFTLVLLSGILLLQGRYLGKGGTILLTVGILIFTVYNLLISNLWIENYNITSLFNIKSWIKIKFFAVYWSVLYNTFNKNMLLIVYLVTFCVIIYSYYYMKNDPHIVRYYGYICLFIICMSILVISNNYLTLFFGWEGVGICSYLLVNFWFTRINANKSAIKALLVNRIGDLSIILGIICIYFFTGTCEFSSALAIVQLFAYTQICFWNLNIQALFLIAFFLIGGAIGKSAQIGLHTWLPDAMEGPTPISALIHAATMVTAGVLLLIKSSVIFENAPSSLLILVLLGGLTSFFAASVGLLQTDIKKIIAYSTCSQLGYMIFICGLSNYTASFFHLLNHAFFKALLFLSAGSIIHSMSDEQDLKKFGGLLRTLIFTSTCFLIGKITLAGFPYLSGFYSKDLILELCVSKYNFYGLAVYYSGIITAMFTIIYSYKIYNLTFIAKPLNNKLSRILATESSVGTNLPLIILTIGSIFFGWVNKDKFVGMGSNYFGQNSFVNILTNNVISVEFISNPAKIRPFFFILFSVLIVSSWTRFNVLLSFMNRQIYMFISKMWFFDAIYNKVINQPLLRSSYSTYFLNLDKGLFEIVGVKMLTSIFLKKTTLSYYSLIHTGVIMYYSYIMIILALLLIILFFSF